MSTTRRVFGSALSANTQPTKPPSSVDRPWVDVVASSATPSPSCRSQGKAITYRRAPEKSARRVVSYCEDNHDENHVPDPYGEETPKKQIIPRRDVQPRGVGIARIQCTHRYTGVNLDLSEFALTHPLHGTAPNVVTVGDFRHLLAETLSVQPLYVALYGPTGASSRMLHDALELTLNSDGIVSIEYLILPAAFDGPCVDGCGDARGPTLSMRRECLRRIADTVGSAKSCALADYFAQHGAVSVPAILHDESGLSNIPPSLPDYTQTGIITSPTPTLMVAEPWSQVRTARRPFQEQDDAARVRTATGWRHDPYYYAVPFVPYPSAASREGQFVNPIHVGPSAEPHEPPPRTSTATFVEAHEPHAGTPVELREPLTATPTEARAPLTAPLQLPSLVCDEERTNICEESLDCIICPCSTPVEALPLAPHTSPLLKFLNALSDVVDCTTPQLCGPEDVDGGTSLADTCPCEGHHANTPPATSTPPTPTTPDAPPQTPRLNATPDAPPATSSAPTSTTLNALPQTPRLNATRQRAKHPTRIVRRAVQSAIDNASRDVAAKQKQSKARQRRERKEAAENALLAQHEIKVAQHTATEDEPLPPQTRFHCGGGIEREVKLTHRAALFTLAIDVDVLRMWMEPHNDPSPYWSLQRMRTWICSTRKQLFEAVPFTSIRARLTAADRLVRCAYFELFSLKNTLSEETVRAVRDARAMLRAVETDGVATTTQGATTNPLLLYYVNATTAIALWRVLASPGNRAALPHRERPPATVTWSSLLRDPITNGDWLLSVCGDHWLDDYILALFIRSFAVSLFLAGREETRESLSDCAVTWGRFWRSCVEHPRSPLRMFHIVDRIAIPLLREVLRGMLCSPFTSSDEVIDAFVGFAMDSDAVVCKILGRVDSLHLHDEGDHLAESSDLLSRIVSDAVTHIHTWWGIHWSMFSTLR